MRDIWIQISPKNSAEIRTISLHIFITSSSPGTKNPIKYGANKNAIHPNNVKRIKEIQALILLISFAFCIKPAPTLCPTSTEVAIESHIEKIIIN